MTKTVLLNFAEHKDLKIITDKSAALGDDCHYAFTFVSEFRQVQAHYPIFLQKDSQTGQFLPTALLGLKPQQNLFLQQNCWQASYIPLAIERLPFSIGVQGEQRVIHIDLASPKISTTQGEALFGEFGAYTPYLERIGQSLELLHQGVAENAQFISSLLEYHLLESLSLDIELNSGETMQLSGLYTINENKLAELSADTLKTLQQQGMLDAIYMMLASQSQLANLVQKANALQG
ncbi:SapC family protein [Pseudoalteromonas fenneropenaei]|uniref:SapC family protein n=1 Tax=Pseudoalteromonas fenneropenaei TaxID=1737459 RepID=A0ABV7CFN9_9GAMM